MKVLFIGDISGSPGRDAVRILLPNIRQSYGVNFVIANAENAAGGRGITRQILRELQGYGIDFFTAGEHVWDIREFHGDLQDPNLSIVRPYNYEGAEQIPGQGYRLIDLGAKRILVIAMLGQTFMRDQVRSPFWAFDELWSQLRTDGVIQGDPNSDPIIIMDFHAETTAEKIAFGWYVHKNISALLGTHTHVPTADARLIGDMAFVTDVGMCGPRDASLWVKYANVVQNFKYPMKQKFEIEESGPKIFNSVLVDFEGNKAISIKRVDREV